MMAKIVGRAVKCGDNVSTDEIIPGKYLTLTKPEELGPYALEGLGPEYPRKVSEYGIVVAGRNFGCGSSREQAPRALKGAGAKCIIAESFARIFLRNAVNIGLPVVVCKEAAERINDGDELEVDLAEGRIIDRTTGEQFSFQKLPPFMLEILESGGLIEYLNRRRRKEGG